MPIYKGLVQQIEIRGDGWVEIFLQAVHAGNARQTFFIPNLDGDLTQTNKRLGQVSLLRDALARVLPVQVEYAETTNQGNLVNDLWVFPRPSIEGRPEGREVSGVVVGLSVAEFGPFTASFPYLDPPDFATVVLLTDAGALQSYMLDLQRADPQTAQAEFAILEFAHENRRPVVLTVSGTDNSQSQNPSFRGAVSFARGPSTEVGEWISAVRWVTVPTATLDYQYAFVERLGQRYESYDPAEAAAVSRAKVVYTTAPGQTPEGDVSDNGSFAPQRLTAWVPDASPLFRLLDQALRESLQVKLGLSGIQIHEVEMVSPLGSAARPIWIVEECGFTAIGEEEGACSNVPTVQGPSSACLERVARTVSWRGKGYFRQGIWRFVSSSTPPMKLKIDGHEICCGKNQAGGLEHAYLQGMHHVEVELAGVTCATNFSVSIYRIR